MMKEKKMGSKRYIALLEEVAKREKAILEKSKADKGLKGYSNGWSEGFYEGNSATIDWCLKIAKEYL
jgi:hypothetical protein